MKTAYGFILLAGFTLGLNAHATASHIGKVDLELSLVDQKGKTDKIASKDAAFRLDWNTQKCEVQIKDQYAYCNLDTSRDLVNARGDLIMKAMPQAHFDSKTVDAVISLMARDDKNSSLVEQVVRETQAERASGFDLPFYTCANQISGNPDCMKNGKDLLLYNAFKNQSYVLRQIEIKHPRLGGKTLVMKFKISDIKAYSNAFNIIGNNNAGNFGGR